MIVGSAMDDAIDGRGGDDLICGLGGDDVLVGGLGAGPNRRRFRRRPARRRRVRRWLPVPRVLILASRVTPRAEATILCLGGDGSDTICGDSFSPNANAIGGGNDEIFGGDGIDRIAGDSNTKGGTATGGGNDLIVGARETTASSATLTRSSRSESCQAPAMICFREAPVSTD